MSADGQEILAESLSQIQQSNWAKYLIKFNSLLYIVPAATSSESYIIFLVCTYRSTYYFTDSFFFVINKCTKRAGGTPQTILVLYCVGDLELVGLPAAQIRGHKGHKGHKAWSMKTMGYLVLNSNI